MKLVSKVGTWPFWYTIWKLEEKKVTKHRIPFDFCDECGRKFPTSRMRRTEEKKSDFIEVSFLCEECTPPWQEDSPEDYYDLIPKKVEGEQ